MPPPRPPDAVRAYLLADVPFSTACAGRVGGSLPPDMTKPFVQLRVISNAALSGTHFAKSPLIQADMWVPLGRPTPPEDEAADLAEMAAELLSKARNVSYLTMTWSGRLVDGPTPGPPDTSRGEGAPLIRSWIHVEMTTHTR